MNNQQQSQKETDGGKGRAAEGCQRQVLVYPWTPVMTLRTRTLAQRKTQTPKDPHRVWGLVTDVQSRETQRQEVDSWMLGKQRDGRKGAVQEMRFH